MGISPHENTPGSDFECHTDLAFAAGQALHERPRGTTRHLAADDELLISTVVGHLRCPVRSRHSQEAPIRTSA